MKRNGRSVALRACLLLGLLACLLLAGCGESQQPLEAQNSLEGGVADADGKPKTAASVLEAIAQGQAFDELTALDREMALGYLDIPEEGVAEIAMSMDASRATPEMIAVVNAVDESAVATAEERLEGYQSSLAAQYESYRPEEMPKIRDAVFGKNGLQLVLVISKDAVKAGETLESLWQK